MFKGFFMSPSEIIDLYGGTAEVARLCEISLPSVSEWRRLGIPKGRLLYLKAINPVLFAEVEHASIINDFDSLDKKDGV